MAYAAVICVERTIEELINSPRISLSPPCKEMMEFAYQQLKSCQQILKILDGSSKAYCRKKVNGVDARIKEAVWEFQDLIDSHLNNQILSQSDKIPRYDVHLHELIPDVDDFTQKLKKMEEEYIYELDHLMPEEAVSSTTNSDVRKVKLVGSSQILIEIEWILKSNSYFFVIQLVGMAGIGKTALCKEIFNDSLEVGFECRAWVTVGRKYRVNKLERDILVQLEPNAKMLIEGSLKEILKTKRCLIVLDSVWDTDILNRLEISISPDEGITTRVLITTRLQDVASYFVPHLPAETYDLGLLNKDQSWDVLRERVFGEHECPRELEKHGKKIAEKCDGLPLTIVTVANLLSKAQKTAEYWKSVAKNKKSSISWRPTTNYMRYYFQAMNTYRNI